MKRLSIFLSCLIFALGTVRADSVVPLAWMDFMAGPVAPGFGYGIRFNVNALDGWTLSPEFISSGEVCIFCTAEEATQLNLSLGRSILAGNTLFNFSAGVGSLREKKRGERVEDGDWFGPTYKMIDVNTIGIPLEVGFLRVWRNLGIGGRWHVNVNRVQPLFGITLNISLGGFR